jgi:hypothetical protein
MTIHKLLPFILWTILLPGLTSAQDSRIDSLIEKLDNSQICLDGNYFGPLICLQGEPAVQLYKLGKPASEKLVEVLEDSSKGIIAHIILTQIWDRAVFPEVISSEKDSLLIMKYNEFTFFVNHKDEVYANPKDLFNNTFRWRGFLRSIVTPETAVQIKILGSPNEKEIFIQVNTKNVLNRSIEITSNRRERFKAWETDYGIFNYLIELQKFEGNCYSVFGPSADIDPTYEEENFTEFKAGTEISDTLKLPGYIFSRSGKSPGTFPTGEYRIRVFFRKTWWTNLTGESEWVKFSIE